MSGPALLAAALLFIVGLAGVLVRRSLLVTILSVELCLTAAAMTFAGYGAQRGDPGGIAAAVVVIVVGAVWALTATAACIAVFRRRATVNLDELRELRG